MSDAEGLLIGMLGAEVVEVIEHERQRGIGMQLLWAWWRWDKWCRAMTSIDPKTGRMPYPTRSSGERQSDEFEAALQAFAVWACVDSVWLREELAELSRMAGPEPLIGFGIRQSVRLVPDVMREGLAAIVGHS